MFQRSQGVNTEGKLWCNLGMAADSNGRQDFDKTSMELRLIHVCAQASIFVVSKIHYINLNALNLA